MESAADYSNHEEPHGRSGAPEGTSGPTETSITARAVMDLLKSQQHKCALTGRPLTPEVAALDHTIPLSRGGENNMQNVQIVHVDANKAKSTMTRDEFLSLCGEVVAHCG